MTYHPDSDINAEIHADALALTRNPLAPTRHDAGGSKRWPLQPGVRGLAHFAGPDDCYRFWLRRDWGENSVSLSRPYALFIGMNPSTAEGDIDDPTIRAEMDFCRAFGYESYIKCNVGAYRASFPDDLAKAGVDLCPDANLSTIVAYATHAGLIVAAWGKLPKVLQRDGEAVAARLKSIGATVHCLGKTKDGFPRHPLYVKRTTPLEAWP